MRRVLRFFQLGRRARSVFVRSLIWVILYRVGLFVLPSRWCKQWTPGRKGPERVAPDPQIVVEIVRSVKLVSRYVPYASCLTQSLAALKLLEVYGQAADLKIGVAKQNGRFEAHAWLEIDGQIVLGKQREHSRYVVLGGREALLR
mgnify:CR=1 FL=1